MARYSNFLLGQGERLTRPVVLHKGGGPKDPPYTLREAQERVTRWLGTTVGYFAELPPQACPQDRVVAAMMLHPRYIAKSDFPSTLLDHLGLEVVGGRSRVITPEKWGANSPPQTRMTDELFIAGARRIFVQWLNAVPGWDATVPWATDLQSIELISEIRPEDKTKELSRDQHQVLEVVLHGDDPAVVHSFEAYVSEFGAQVSDSRRHARGLAFVPVVAPLSAVQRIAEFSFVRAVRTMPTLRPMEPGITRARIPALEPGLADEPPIRQDMRVAIFDGGLPPQSKVSRWATLIEPEGLGPAHAAYVAHGLAVTSAFLFGPLEPGAPPPRPWCYVDHIRVLDTSPDETGMYYDVLDRIVAHLDDPSRHYTYVNISLGPDVPASDDDVTLWTAALDSRFASGSALATVAVGNAGENDHASELDRIQPPSDGVNILAVGATDGRRSDWRRAPYSSVGPGRMPGIVKPDGLAFGGSAGEPFYVMGRADTLVPQTGTSFAAPHVLRTAVAVGAQLTTPVEPLAIRALLIHRAEPDGHPRPEVGWGRFETDDLRLMTCEDNEVHVIYQGMLPVAEYLRVPVPLPNGPIVGKVIMTVTLLLASDIDPGFPSSYTTHGLEMTFRPNIDRLGPGSVPKSAAFVNKGTVALKKGDIILTRQEYKWETCLRATKTFKGSTLKGSYFDIYHHTRDRGHAQLQPTSVPYALVIGVTAPKDTSLYSRVVRTYANVLVPLRPDIRITVPQASPATQPTQ